MQQNGRKMNETQRVTNFDSTQSVNSSLVKKVDFNKTANDGFSIQSAIKRSILKQHNLNTTQTSGAASQNKTERSTNNSLNR